MKGAPSLSAETDEEGRYGLELAPRRDRDQGQTIWDGQGTEHRFWQHLGRFGYPPPTGQVGEQP